MLRTAKDVMTQPLITLQESDSVWHAAEVFLDNNISGAPVLNAEGRAVGVLSKTDIIRYEREYLVAVAPAGQPKSLTSKNSLELLAQLALAPRKSDVDSVSAWMTPHVYCVEEEQLLQDIVQEMASRRVHRLFVKNTHSEHLVGVITTFDMLEHLSHVIERSKRVFQK